MKELMELELTIFILLLCGAFLKRKGIVGTQGEKNLTDLVIDLILPCNIVVSFTTELSDTALTECAQMLLISCAIQVLAVVYGKLISHRASPDKQVNIRYATITSNAGFLGNPVAEGLYGPIGLMLASVYLIPQRIMMWSEGISLYSGEKDRKAVLKKVLTHPCVIACMIGLVIMIGRIDLPPLVLTPIQTLGKCNTGISMLVIGMILADMDPRTFLDKDAILFTLHRLIIIPAIVLLFCHFLPVSALVAKESTILAAMPAAVTTGMLAAKYERDPKFATTLVVLTTLCSIPTLFLWSLILMG